MSLHRVRFLNKLLRHVVSHYSLKTLINFLIRDSSHWRDCIRNQHRCYIALRSLRWPLLKLLYAFVRWLFRLRPTMVCNWFPHIYRLVNLDRWVSECRLWVEFVKGIVWSLNVQVAHSYLTCYTVELRYLMF